MLPFWHHLELIVSTTTNESSSSPCFLPPQEQAWPLFRESLGCLREDLSLNNMVIRFRFRTCYCMSTRKVKLFYLYDGDSTTRGDAQSPFRSQIQKKYFWQCYFLLYQVGDWIILYKTNSLLFEREAWFPNDRPITKNPDHALGASCWKSIKTWN